MWEIVLRAWIGFHQLSKKQTNQPQMMKHGSNNEREKQRKEIGSRSSTQRRNKIYSGCHQHEKVHYGFLNTEI
jgi:hypothetical protein